MEQYYIFEDNKMIASTPDKEQALALIRTYQASQTHPLLQSEYSIIKGVMEFIPYKKGATQ